RRIKKSAGLITKSIMKIKLEQTGTIQEFVLGILYIYFKNNLKLLPITKTMQISCSLDSYRKLC
ncbi:hypothetical protein, partial [Bacillus thuringiensis]